MLLMVSMAVTNPDEQEFERWASNRFIPAYNCENTFYEETREFYLFSTYGYSWECLVSEQEEHSISFQGDTTNYMKKKMREGGEGFALIHGGSAFVGIFGHFIELP